MNIGTKSCLDIMDEKNEGGYPSLFPCHKMGGNQVNELLFL